MSEVLDKFKFDNNENSYLTFEQYYNQIFIFLSFYLIDDLNKILNNYLYIKDFNLQNSQNYIPELYKLNLEIYPHKNFNEYSTIYFCGYGSSKTCMWLKEFEFLKNFLDSKNILKYPPRSLFIIAKNKNTNNLELLELSYTGEYCGSIYRNSYIKLASAKFYRILQDKNEYKLMYTLNEISNKKTKIYNINIIESADLNYIWLINMFHKFGNPEYSEIRKNIINNMLKN